MPIADHENGRVIFSNTEWGRWSMPMRACSPLRGAIDALRKHFAGITDDEIIQIVGKYYTVPTEAIEHFIHLSKQEEEK